MTEMISLGSFKSGIKMALKTDHADQAKSIC